MRMLGTVDAGRIRKTKRRAVRLQQRDGCRNVFLFASGQSIPPKAELISIFHRPCHWYHMYCNTCTLSSTARIPRPSSRPSDFAQAPQAFHRLRDFGPGPDRLAIAGARRADEFAAPPQCLIAELDHAQIGPGPGTDPSH